MKHLLGFLIALLLPLAACQAKGVPVTILADGETYTMTSSETTPAALLAEAGISLAAEDRVLFLDAPVPLDTPLPSADPITLIVRRAVSITLVTSAGVRTLRTSAATLGEALGEAGYALILEDRVDPPAEAIPVEGLTVTYQPAAPCTVSVDGQDVEVLSAAATVGQALAESGIPLTALDRSIPPAEAPLPGECVIQVVRVVETISLVQQVIPYDAITEASASLELDQWEVTQAGQPGLSVNRIRIRIEDGVDTSRVAEDEVQIRPVQDQVTSYGTQVVMRTAVVDGITITYWRAMQFWVTSYHPAETGGTRTASGQEVRVGLAAVDRNYIPFGTQMYVPGYGYAEAADTGAFSGRWLDLAYLDENYVPWHQWVTVYFIGTPPASIPYIIPDPCTWKGYCP